MKIYLAGYESWGSKIRRNLQEGIDLERSIFGSYYYKDITTKMIIEEKRFKRKGLVTIDSGAFSFLVKFGITGKKAEVTDLSEIQKYADRYFDEYLSWVKEYYNYFDYFVELDIQEILGYGAVRKYRNRIRREGLAKKCIMVHHWGDKWDKWERLVKESEAKYIGMPKARTFMPKWDYKRYIRYAYKQGCRVHGFALINFDLLTQVPFWSVDSSTWLSTIKFGRIMSLCEQSGKLRSVSDKGKIVMLNYKNDLNLKKLETRADRLVFASREYGRLEKFLTDLWNKRGIRWNV